MGSFPKPSTSTDLGLRPRLSEFISQEKLVATPLADEGFSLQDDASTEADANRYFDLLLVICRRSIDDDFEDQRVKPQFHREADVIDVDISVRLQQNRTRCTELHHWGCSRCETE